MKNEHTPKVTIHKDDHAEKPWVVSVEHRFSSRDKARTVKKRLESNVLQ